MTAGLPPFQRLLDDHGAAVWRYLRAVTGPDDADDCYQETMLAALRAYPSLRDSTNLRGWLLTIARRKVVDTARSRARLSVGLADAADIAGPAPSEPPDSGLLAALERLPRGQRDAVALRHGADLAYADVAALLGCSEAAARQRVRAALEALRAALEPLEV
jgi:RNA polymerase sigma factor (sigma-70 family)